MTGEPVDPREREGMVEMTLAEHLEELRRRVIVSLAAVVLAMFAFLFMKDTVMAFVTRPYEEAWRKRAAQWYENEFSAIDPSQYGPAERERYEFVKAHWDEIVAGRTFKGRNVFRMLEDFGFPLPRRLISITPLQDLVTYMLAAALAGLIFAAPIVLHQAWAFVAAGLYRSERRKVLRYLPFSLLLFAGGAAFGYYVMVPYALLFLTGLASPMVEFNLTVRDYFRFLFALTAALGFVFQLPVVMLGLVKLRICTPALYTKYWRHAIVTMFIIGAVLTPPDPFTQILMAGPMILLFGLGLLLAKLAYARMEPRKEEERA